MAIVPVNVGTGPDTGTGDTITAAFLKLNASIATLAAVTPIVITALDELTLASGVELPERTAYKTLIGALEGMQVNSVVDITDDGGMQVYLDMDMNLYAGQRAASFQEGDVTFKVREIAFDGVTRMERTTTIVLPVTQVVDPTVYTAPDQHFRAVAHGTGSGNSWANAKGISTLAAAYAAAAPGTKLGILADEPISYTASGPMPLTPAGTSGNEVQIRGYGTDYRPRHALIVGTRAKWARPTNPETVTNCVAVIVDGVALNMKIDGPATGNAIFTINGSYGRLDWLAFQHCRVALYDGTSDHWTFNDLAYFNVARCNGEDIGQAAAPNQNNHIFNRQTCIGASKPAFRKRGNSYAVYYNYCDLDLRRIDGDAFQVGFSLDDRSTSSDPVLKLEAAHDIHYNHCIARNGTQNGGTGYWNADGFSSERKNYNVTLTDCEFTGFTDGGVDFKGTQHVLTRVHCEDNKRNFRIWPHDVVMVDCTSKNPYNRGGSGGRDHIWLAGLADFSGTVPPPADVMWTGGSMINDAGFTGGINMLDTKGGNVLRLINVTETNLPADGVQASSLILRANSAPSGIPAITSPTTVSLPEGFVGQIPVTANRDVSVKLQGGADLTASGAFASLTLVKSPINLRPQEYASGGDNDRQVQVKIEDIARNAITPTITANITAISSSPVLDANFGAGSAHSQPSPDGAGNAITYGSAVFVEQFAVGDNRARFPSNTSSVNNRVSLADNANYQLSGAFTLILDKVYIDALGTAQVLCGQFSAGGTQRSWMVRIETTGALSMFFSEGGSANTYVYTGPVLSAATDYPEIRITRGITGAITTYINGVATGPVGNYSGVTKDSTSVLSIGSLSDTQQVFKGWIKRVRLINGKAIAP